MQWQALNGRVLGPTNSLPGVRATALSYDAKGTRAVTVVFEFPPGWVMDRPHYLNSDQEMFVLAGEIEFGGTVYAPGDYAYIPAGFAHRLLRSPKGATVLNFYEGEHLAFYAAAPAGMYQPRKLIHRIRSAGLGWRRARERGEFKRLRRDRGSGEETWLLRVPAQAPGPDGVRGAPRLHDAVEEFFLLEGEVATPQGTMKSGAYAWRAPGTPVGPAFSRSGYVALLRSKGGAPGGRSVDGIRELPLDPPYAPCLPEAMRSAIAPH
ncbi:MAG: hypothetical protein U1F11_04670 [Steroidobacteraceae bacterium]